MNNSMYVKLISELKKERKLINKRIDTLTNWMRGKTEKRKTWKLNAKQKKTISRSMKKVWEEKRKGER